MNPNASNDLAQAELDLTIPGMEEPREEQRAEALLAALPGVIVVRLISRGAVVRYDPLATSGGKICDALQQSGFAASVYQDSKPMTRESPHTD